MHLESLGAGNVIAIDKEDASATDMVFGLGLPYEGDSHLPFKEDRSPTIQNCPDPSHPPKRHRSLPRTARLISRIVFFAHLSDRRDANGVEEMYLTVR